MAKAFNLALLTSLINVSACCQIVFSDITGYAGVSQLGKNYGVSIADFNNDGFEDIFAFRHDQPCRLFKNKGDGTFANVAMLAGIAYTGTPSAGVWADINNDGWLDLFIGTRDENNVLYLNNQDGTFTNVTAMANVLSGGKVRAALFADVDMDGWIDIYLARLNAENILYRNNGNLTFTNYTQASGATNNNVSMGAIFFDYDNDGDPDLYLTHDADRPFKLYQNDGTGHFTDVSVASGANIAAQGMGVDFGDINNDGWLDIYVTNLYQNALLLNNGNGTFKNIAAEAEVNDVGMGWGCSFLDFNNDGWQDIYMANDSRFSPWPNLMYENLGNNSFRIASTGSPLHSMDSGYGLATFDYGDDGKIDIYLANYLGTVGNQLFQNSTINDNNWVKIKATGTLSNRAAIGTKVTLEVNGKKLTDEISGGSGYTSQNSLVLHFGLGPATIIDKMTIRWPNGLNEEYQNIAINTTYQVIEGQGILTDTKEPKQSEFKIANVFPNPFKDSFSLSVNFEEEHDLEITLLDLSGKTWSKVFKGKSAKGSIETVVDTKYLPSGMYLLRVKSPFQTGHLRIIKC